MAKNGWELKDEHWARIEPLLPKPKADRSRTRRGWYHAHTPSRGGPMRATPSEHGLRRTDALRLRDTA